MNIKPTDVVKGADFSDSTMVERDYCGVRFVHCTFTRAILTGCKLNGARFEDCLMDGVRFMNCEGPDVVFSKSNLTSAYFDQSMFRRVNFQGAPIKNMTVHACVMDDAFIAAPDASQVEFRDASLANAYMAYQDMRSASLLGCDMEKTVCIGTDFSNANFDRVVLTGANLTQTRVAKAHFHRCNLTRVELNQVRGLDSVGAFRACNGVAVIDFDVRGYRLIIGYKTIAAGCRVFSTVEDALAHWRAPDYHTPALGEQYARVIETFAHIVEEES